jgi:hypothetical protein
MLSFSQKVKTDEAKSNTDATVSTLTKTKELKDGWSKGGSLNFNFSEGGLNKAWRQVKGGEEQTIGIKAIIDYDFDLKKGKINWLNNIRARYGMSRITSTGQGFQKTDDYLSFTSIYAKEMNKKWSMAGLFSLSSQFDYFFLSPGEIKLGYGVLYKPNNNFSLMISPAMMNLTTKLATQQKNVALFGVDSGKTVKFGFGSFLQLKASYDIAKSISYKGFATLYSDYLNKPDVVIMDWTNLFTLTVNKYIGATVSVNIRYNDWELGKLQVQHGLGVGFSYKL